MCIFIISYVSDYLSSLLNRGKAENTRVINFKVFPLP